MKGKAIPYATKIVSESAVHSSAENFTGSLFGILKKKIFTHSY